MEIVSAHGLVQLCDIVRAYLVAQSARARMDEQNNSILRKSILRSSLLVENFVHVFHFEEMITRAKRAQLRLSALLGARADRGWVGTRDAASLFSVIKIGFRAHVVLDRPSRPLLENMVEIAIRNVEMAGAAGAGGYVPKELMYQVPQLRFDVLAS